MVLTIGKPTKGRLALVDTEFSKESVPGAIYQIHIETEGIPDPKRAVEVLMTELPRRFHAKILWIRMTDKTIDMQIEGSPFAWAALLLALPVILTTAAIVMILVAVYAVFAAIPGWALGMLVIGTVLLLLSPVLPGIIRGE